MEKLQTKLTLLLNKYSVDENITIKDMNTVILDGKELPMFPHRSERRFTELKNSVTGGTLKGISVMRVARTVGKGADIYSELYREADICEFVLDRTVSHITVMRNGNVLNAIAATKDGVVCTLEISATLKENEPPKDKHEIISQRGIACDVVVDAQLRQNSIYVFGETDAAYTDVDFELYGLSADEIAVVRAAFEIAKKKNTAELTDTDSHLKKIVAAAKRSEASGEREEI